MDRDLEAWLREISELRDDAPAANTTLEGLARITETFEQLRSLAANVSAEELTLLERHVDAVIGETCALLDRVSLIKALLLALRD
jgi:hypothetical protein